MDGERKDWFLKVISERNIESLASKFVEEICPGCVYRNKDLSGNFDCIVKDSEQVVVDYLENNGCWAAAVEVTDGSGEVIPVKMDQNGVNVIGSPVDGREHMEKLKKNKDGAFVYEFSKPLNSD